MGLRSLMIDIQKSCEIVSKCMAIAEKIDQVPFWDFKAVGIAGSLIGITGSIIWQYITFKSTKGRRAQDQKWSIYKDEIYTPFTDLLKKFEESAKTPQLPTELSEMNLSEIQEKIGTLSIICGEIEILCKRADTHPKADITNFFDKFNVFSNAINTCVEKILTSEHGNPTTYLPVATAYSDLIKEMRANLTAARVNLEK